MSFQILFICQSAILEMICQQFCMSVSFWSFVCQQFCMSVSICTLFVSNFASPFELCLSAISHVCLLLSRELAEGWYSMVCIYVQKSYIFWDIPSGPTSPATSVNYMLFNPNFPKPIIPAIIHQISKWEVAFLCWPSCLWFDENL